MAQKKKNPGKFSRKRGRGKETCGETPSSCGKNSWPGFCGGGGNAVLKRRIKNSLKQGASNGHGLNFWEGD